METDAGKCHFHLHVTGRKVSYMAKPDVHRAGTSSCCLGAYSIGRDSEYFDSNIIFFPQMPVLKEGKIQGWKIQITSPQLVVFYMQ